MKKSQDQISYNMKKVKCKDTKIERTLCKEVWSRGLRYRKNAENIYGKPDLVFIGKKLAVFCDSEFWHGYNWHEKKNEIKTNQDFWIAKIERNIERDREVNEYLQNMGWTVLRFWGKDILKNTEKCADIVEKTLRESR